VLETRQSRLVAEGRGQNVEVAQVLVQLVGERLMRFFHPRREPVQPLAVAGLPLQKACTGENRLAAKPNPLDQRLQLVFHARPLPTLFECGRDCPANP